MEKVRLLRIALYLLLLAAGSLGAGNIDLRQRIASLAQRYQLDAAHERRDLKFTEN
ncbi:MAG: hypothetical protein OHK0011_22900 [Turneriella sp.]